MHVAVSSVDRLLDYCLHTAPDGYRTGASVETLTGFIRKNRL
jgi:4-O-beta-D-mannosyl-D-glucose phosphorylase